jgi:hypothetical protein
MQLLTVAISSKNFGGATSQPQIPTVCCLVYPPVPPTFLLPLSTLFLLFHASILITCKSYIHYAKALLLQSVVARRRFTVRSDCCCFFVCICPRLKQLLPSIIESNKLLQLYTWTLSSIIFTMTMTFRKPKIFCSLLTLARGHLDLAGGTAPFYPLGYGPDWAAA